MTVEFQSWPKIPRLASPFIITEKIDGTNSAVLIEEEWWGPSPRVDHPACVAVVFGGETDPDDGFPVQQYVVYAQSRKRFVTPESDNFGFAAWVRDNAEALVKILGPGRHFGEWWGNGIQRGYGLPKGEKRFSLFNVTRHNPFDNFMDLAIAQRSNVFYGGPSPFPDMPTLGLVPLVSWLNEDTDVVRVGSYVDAAIGALRDHGSYAAEFDKPEGVVLFHSGSRQTFKAFVDDTEKAAEVALRKSDMELVA